MDTSTTFQNYERTEFYHYDHLSGVMTLLVSHGCQRAFTHAAIQARQIWRVSSTASKSRAYRLNIDYLSHYLALIMSIGLQA